MGDGRFVHGRTLDGGWVAFYRRIAGRAGEWEAGSRDFAFTVAVEPLLGEVVGEDPFGPGESPAPPPEWRQDGSGFFYTTDGADERLAAASQCVGLERHGVAWTVEQVAERFVKGFRSPFWRLRAPVLYGSDGRRERRFWPALGEVPLLRHDLDFLRSAGRREAAAGQAERLLEAAWLKNPSGPWLADHLREFAEVTFSSPAAAQALEEAVAFPGVGAESHFRCAIDWFGAGRYSRCLEQVARAVQMDRHLEFEGRLLKANAYLEWGDLAAAGVELRRKTASGQEGSVAWLSQSASRDALKCLRAKLCFVHGNHGPAYRLYRQVCPDPAACDSPAAREALLMQAVLARTAGRWDEAEELLRACLNIWEAIGPDRQPAGLHEESPGLARTLIEFGALLTAKSRLDEAADLLREAGRLLEPRAGDSHPLVALAQFHLGRVSMQREDEPEARRHLCAALQIQWTALLPSHPDLVRTEELLRVLGYLPNFV